MEKLHLMRVYMSGAHAALRKQRCYPWRTFVTPVMMTPFFFASVLGARHLVMMGDVSFEEGTVSGLCCAPCCCVRCARVSACQLRACRARSPGGILWFSDLTMYDPTFVLPMTAASLSYAVLEVGV
jgi:hypothetical protein